MSKNTKLEKNLVNYKESEYKIISEDSIKLKIFEGKISKKLPVFYNPIMKLNRDLSLVVLDTYFNRFIKYQNLNEKEKSKEIKEDDNKKEITIALPLSGSGIRGLKFLNVKSINELIKEIHFNDLNKVAYNNILDNLKINSFDKLLDKKVFVHNLDANYFLNLKRWDHIEIDPFGSPVFFLENALLNIKNRGILSITATDTAALCGTYPSKTKKRYFINVKKTFWYDEVGLRNLISYVIREAAKFNIATIPLLSYSQDHYYKVFFQVKFSKSKVNQLLEELKYIYWNEKQDIWVEKNCQKELLGPIFVGNLNNKEFLKLIDIKIIKNNSSIEKLLNLLKEELNIVGYIELHKLAKYHGIKKIPKFSTIIEEIKRAGFKVSRTHNSKYGIKTNMSKDELINLLKTLEKNKY